MRCPKPKLPRVLVSRCVWSAGKPNLVGVCDPSLCVKPRPGRPLEHALAATRTAAVDKAAGSAAITERCSLAKHYFASKKDICVVHFHKNAFSVRFCSKKIVQEIVVSRVSHTAARHTFARDPTPFGPARDFLKVSLSKRTYSKR